MGLPGDNAEQLLDHKLELGWMALEFAADSGRFVLVTKDVNADLSAAACGLADRGGRAQAIERLERARRAGDEPLEQYWNALLDHVAKGL